MSSYSPVKALAESNDQKTENYNETVAVNDAEEMADLYKPLTNSGKDNQPSAQKSTSKAKPNSITKSAELQEHVVDIPLQDVKRKQMNRSSSGLLKKDDVEDVSKIRKHNWLMIGSSFVILILLIIFVSLYGKAQGTLNKFMESTFNKCYSSECVKKAGLIMQNMDTSIDPCDDFYMYACNGFHERNYATTLEDMYRSTFDELYEQRMNKLTRIVKGELDEHFKRDVFSKQPEVESLYAGLKKYHQRCEADVTYDTVMFFGSSWTSQYNVAALKASRVTSDWVKSEITALDTSSSNYMAGLAAAFTSLNPNPWNVRRGYDYMESVLTTWLFESMNYAVYNPSLEPVFVILSPNFYYISYDYADQDVRNAMITYVATVMKSYLYPTISNPDLNAMATNIVDFQRRLMPIIEERPYYISDTDLEYISIDELHSRYPNIMNSVNGWKSFFTSIGVPADLVSDTNKKGGSFKIHLSCPLYFGNLSAILGETPVNVVKHFAEYSALTQLGGLAQLQGYLLPYLAWDDVVVGHSGTVPSLNFGAEYKANIDALQRFRSERIVPIVKAEPKFRAPKQVPDAIYEFFDRVSGKSDEEALLLAQNEALSASAGLDYQPIFSYQTEKCTNDVAEKFALLIGRLYSSLLYPGTKRDELKKLMSDIKETYRMNLLDGKDDEWLTSDALKSILRKLDLMKVFAAVPEEAFITNFMKEIYDGMVFNSPKGSFADAIDATRSFNLFPFRKWKHEYVNISMIQYMDWTEVNAFYFPGYNRVVFPMGLMDELVTSPSVADAVNYGVIGMIFGHEITHGFDNSGVLFNEYGQYETIIEEDSVEMKYFAKAQCFASFYEQFRFMDIPVDGNLTLGENIADNGGWLLSMDTFKRNGAKSVSLPGIDLTPEQLFFVSSAQVWCTKGDPLYVEYFMKYGVHTIFYLRINAGMMLLPEFSEAFKCPVGSFMRPASSCKLWKKDIVPKPPQSPPTSGSSEQKFVPKPRHVQHPSDSIKKDIVPKPPQAPHPSDLTKKDIVPKPPQAPHPSDLTKKDIVPVPLPPMPQPPTLKKRDGLSETRKASSDELKKRDGPGDYEEPQYW